MTTKLSAVKPPSYKQQARVNPPQERSLIQETVPTPQKTLHLKNNTNKQVSRKLGSLITNFMPVAIIAILTYIMITAPFFGFLIFGIPLFLTAMSTILGKDCNGTARKLKTGLGKKQVMNKIKKMITQDDITKEGKNLLRFIKSEHVQFGEQIGQNSFLKLLKKYIKNDDRFKNNKKVEKELRSMVDNIFANKKRIAEVLDKAT